MIKLHESAGEKGADIARYLGSLQTADDRIDIGRAVWEEQMADTGRLLQAHPQTRKLQDPEDRDAA